MFILVFVFVVNVHRGIGQLRLGKLIAPSLSPSFPFQQGITAQVSQSLIEVLVYDGAPKDRVALPPPSAPFPTIHV